MNLKDFWLWVERKGPHDCWPWRGSVCSSGYGTLRVGNKTKAAHRIAFGKSVNDFECIMHICHNPRCCNPNHLKGGTNKENYLFRNSRKELMGSSQIADNSFRVRVTLHGKRWQVGCYRTKQTAFKVNRSIRERISILWGTELLPKTELDVWRFFREIEKECLNDS